MLSISGIGGLSKIYNNVPQTLFGRHIVFAPFLITSPRRVMYCYSTFLFHYYYSYSYYYSSTHFCPLNFLEIPWSNFMKPCKNIICHVKVCCEGLIFFQNGCRCHGNGQNAKKIEKHENYHSRLLAEQKLMKLARNNIHI